MSPVKWARSHLYSGLISYKWFGKDVDLTCIKWKHYSCICRMYSCKTFLVWFWTAKTTDIEINFSVVFCWIYLLFIENFTFISANGPRRIPSLQSSKFNLDINTYILWQVWRPPKLKSLWTTVKPWISTFCTVSPHLYTCQYTEYTQTLLHTSCIKSIFYYYYYFSLFSLHDVETSTKSTLKKKKILGCWHVVLCRPGVGGGWVSIWELFADSLSPRSRMGLTL